MNGRMYDAVLGRMLSPDKYVQDGTNTQAYNRYSYVMNNPLKYTDPSGWLRLADAPVEANIDDTRGGSGGGSRYIGGLDLTGGGNLAMVSSMFYASNQLYSTYYNWSTGQYMNGKNEVSWQQATTGVIAKAGNNAIKYNVNIYDWYKKYSDGTMEYTDTQYKFEETGNSLFVNERGVDNMSLTNFMEDLISSVWNSEPMRMIIPDMISGGLNVGLGFIGGSKYNFSAHLVTRGKDAGIHFTQTFTGFVGVNADLSVDFSGSRYLGSVDNINFSDYLGNGSVVSGEFVGSATISASHDGFSIPTWVSGSLGYGLSFGGYIGNTTTVNGWNIRTMGKEFP